MTSEGSSSAPPCDDECETGEQPAEVEAGVVAHSEARSTDAQGPNDGIEQHDGAERADYQNQRAILQHGPPRQHADVIAGVLAQDRVGDVEVRRRGRQHRVAPPVVRAEGKQRAEDDAEQNGTGEQRAPRYCLHDLEIAQAAGHLHRADVPIHDQQIAGEPGDGDEENAGLDQAGEITHGDDRIAAGERAVPRPFGGFHGKPASTDQRRHQQPGADQVQPAPARPGHGLTPCAANQPSTSF